MQGRGSKGTHAHSMLQGWRIFGMEMIDDEMEKLRTIEIEMPTRELVRLHALTLGTDRTVADVLVLALASYDDAGGFDVGTPRA